MQYRVSRQPGLELRNPLANLSWMTPARARGGATFHLPPDLRQLASPDKLRAWVEAETEKLNWGHPLVLEYLHQHPAYRPRNLLVVLALAYASQLFSTEEVIRACRTQPVFWLSCEGVIPFVHELRRFRRKNRALLERVLAGVFLHAVCQRFDLVPDMLPPGLETDLRARAAERLDLARDLDSEEV